MPKCYVQLPTTVATVLNPQHTKHQYANIISINKAKILVVCVVIRFVLDRCKLPHAEGRTHGCSPMSGHSCVAA